MGWTKCACSAWRKVGHYDDGDGEPVGECSGCGRPEYRRRPLLEGDELHLLAQSLVPEFAPAYLVGVVEDRPGRPGWLQVRFQGIERVGTWLFTELCTAPPKQRLVRTFSGEKVLRLDVPLGPKDTLLLTWPDTGTPDRDGQQAYTDAPATEHQVDPRVDEVDVRCGTFPQVRDGGGAADQVDVERNP